MKTIRLHDKGAAVEDIQQRLVLVGLLASEDVSGSFDRATAAAVRLFCEKRGLPLSEEVDATVWVNLVDASFYLGDRSLYLRMPHYHGNDVYELQQALNALGFACGDSDGIFGAYTEAALRKFQINMGLPTDGIAGIQTYESLFRLQHSWEGKQDTKTLSTHLGFSRVANVLERHALCLFGTREFTRSVASRMSNLALATNPASRVLSAETLLDAPDKTMLLVHVVLPEESSGSSVPRVSFEDENTLALRLRSALVLLKGNLPRVALEIPGTAWEGAGPGRSAQHYAITLLDALCAALI